MPNLIDDLLPDVDAIRTEVPDVDIGVRPITLTVVKVIASGARSGLGSREVLEKAITSPSGARYRVKTLSTRDVALSGGQYQSGQIKVGPITPAYDGGNVTFGDLDPTPVPGQPTEVYYRLDDPRTGTTWHRKDSLDTSNALHWFLVLTPSGAGP